MKNKNLEKLLELRDRAWEMLDEAVEKELLKDILNYDVKKPNK